MRAFMVAVGLEYQKLAVFTKPAFEWATGLSLELVTDLRGADSPSATKIAPLAQEQHLVIDADLLFLRRVTIPQVDVDTFAACQLQRYGRPMAAAIETYGGGPAPENWISTGFFIAGPAHQEAMAKAREWMRDGLPLVAEEGRLNCALHQLGVRMQRLPLALNTQVLGNVRATSAVHCACAMPPSEKMREVRHYLRHHAHPELRDLLRERGLGNFRPFSPFDGPGAFGAGGRPPVPTPVRNSDLPTRRNNRLAKPDLARSAPTPLGVVGQPVDVTELVREDVNQEDVLPGAVSALNDPFAVRVQDDVPAAPSAPDVPLRGRKKP